MPNKNKKKHQQYYNAQNQNQNNMNGVRRGNNFNHKGHKKSYINPNIICSISDDEATTRANNHNGHKNNGYNNRGSSERTGKSSKNRGKNIAEKFKDMGRQSKKFSIGDDTENAKPLMPSKPHSHISNMPQDVFEMIVTYVQNYFTCFDTNREGLLGAYNKQCTFSLTLNMSNTVAYRQYKFDDYVLKENRNLKRIVGHDDHHVAKRFRLQHKGYIDTLAQICKLPSTEHDPRSFKLDIDFFSPSMIKFSLSGVFKEGKSSDKVRPLRSFHRVFVCIPDPASQMTIVNEQFTISHLTNEQHKAYYYIPPEQRVHENPMRETLAPTPPQDIPKASAIQQSAAGSLSQYPELTEQQKLMLEQFSTQSRLNFEWSKHCLDHVKWNFDEAAKAFIQFKDSIPKDAYH